jgi:hypothetical protein
VEGAGARAGEVAGAGEAGDAAAAGSEFAVAAEANLGVYMHVCAWHMGRNVMVLVCVENIMLVYDPSNKLCANQTRVAVLVPTYKEIILSTKFTYCNIYVLVC